ncbi:MAG: type II toxin-antitoxin system HicA family toxin [Chloroflexi bacterium]|nr:type II toxin-antitoxin system HicA family toxin [Chloroflexota bacterium]
MAEKQPKSGREFVQLAERSDKVRNVREGKGSHVVVEFIDGTSITVPIHANKQLGKGILHKILKAFKAAGVLGLILFVFWLGLRVFSLL